MSLPYDYAAERLDALNAEPYSAKRVGNTLFHENDVPSEDEL